MRLHYAGIGSRKTPLAVCGVMTRAARRLRERGWLLRSGGAIRADRAFEAGAGGAAEIFRPEDATEASMEFASRYHPAWDRCNEIARKLHGRDVFQVLGRTMDEPSRFIVCWTADGKDSGGTGTAIRIAWDYGIPVFNLHHPQALADLGRHLAEFEFTAPQSSTPPPLLVAPYPDGQQRPYSGPGPSPE